MKTYKFSSPARAAPAVIIVLTSLIVHNAYADSFRCGRKLVRNGDSSGLLLKNCGQPDFKDRASAQVHLDGGRQKVRVERWHYKKNSRSLGRAVLIYRGNIVAIESGGR